MGQEADRVASTPTMYGGSSLFALRWNVWGPSAQDVVDRESREDRQPGAARSADIGGRTKHLLPRYRDAPWLSHDRAMGNIMVLPESGPLDDEPWWTYSL
jgi:hypothetical protein